MSPADLERLRAVTTADVWKRRRRAARLRREGGAVEFAYLPEYVEAGGPAVASTLPVVPGVVRTSAGAVPPFFAGLLPEGRRLSNLRRTVKTSADDELSLLLAVGADTVGDVQVVPEGRPPVPPVPLVEVRGAWNEQRFAALLAQAGIVDPVAIPGAQDKVSAAVLSLPVARAHERHLLKLDPPEYRHLVANEAYFLRRAREAGLAVVDAEVVHDADGRAGLLVRRFDRVRGPDGGVVSLACEDACQVLGRWPADKYALTAEAAVTALAGRCAARAPALRTLFRQFVFAWLSGNGDLHAKNLSVLEGTDGEWRVAPAYDLPSTVPYGDTSMAMTVHGRTTGLSRRHWLAFADAIGLAGRAAVSSLDELLEKTSSLVDEVREGALPFDANTTRRLATELRNRRRLASG